MLICSYPKCETKEIKRVVKGLCWACYYRQRNTGTLEYQDRSPKPCIFPDCKDIAIAKGYCDTHRKRVDRHGDVNAGRPDWWGKNPRSRRFMKRIEYDYGLSIDRYKELLTAQGAKCAVSGIPDHEAGTKGTIKGLVLDHCHDTRVFRGFITSPINRGLGCFEDNTQWLAGAIVHLARSRPAFDTVLQEAIDHLQTEKDKGNDETLYPHTGGRVQISGRVGAGTR